MPARCLPAGPACYGEGRSIARGRRGEWAMVSNAKIAEVAALAGDPARAAMLMALLDGRAFTASELARLAGITPQTASGHVARLTTAGLISVEKQGRHRYHRLASPVVARMLEGIGQVAAGNGSARIVTGPRDAALRRARTCYDHLAGALAVALTDSLDCPRSRRAVDRCGCGDQERPRLSRTARDRPVVAAGQARVLPTLPGLERAASAPRRCCRRRHLHALLLGRLDPPGRRHARCRGHAERPARVPGKFRRLGRELINCVCSAISG